MAQPRLGTDNHRLRPRTMGCLAGTRPQRRAHGQPAQRESTAKAAKTSASQELRHSGQPPKNNRATNVHPVSTLTSKQLESGMCSAGDKTMLNARKYTALAVLGVGLAVAAATPAPAKAYWFGWGGPSYGYAGFHRFGYGCGCPRAYGAYFPRYRSYRPYAYAGYFPRYRSYRPYAYAGYFPRYRSYRPFAYAGCFPH